MRAAVPSLAPAPAVAVAASAALLAAILAVSATLPAGQPEAEAAPGGKKPNIVVITTDDQTLASLQQRTMPNTTRLIAGKGTTFTNAIVTTPLCCPSRASWLTGQYAHNHGVTSNGLGYAALEEKDNTLPVWLDRAGYKTAHVGKYLNGYEAAVGEPVEVPPGWNVWYTTLGSTRYYDYEVSANGRRLRFGDHDNDYVTRVINRKAKTLIRRLTPNRKPLFLQLDHRAPHTETGVESRGGCSGRTVPDPHDKQLFRGEPLPLPPSFNEADVSDKPSFIQSRPPLPPTRLKKLTKRYDCALASLRAIDRGVKAIVKALKKTGELRKTVIAFTSDNGYYHGEHRIAVGKIYPYEEAIRVPLVMRVPERYRGGGERIAEISDPVANIDLAPTLLELARAKSCRGGGACRVMDGRSLVGPLAGNQGGFPDDRAVLTEWDFGNNGSQQDGLCRYSGVRVPGAIYVEHTVAADIASGCDPTPEGELYDLDDDPFQLESLDSDGPQLLGLEGELSKRLDGLRDCAGIAGRDPQVEGRPYCE
jgi:N-acetylglucosamine-6-sulfatase